LSEQTTPTEIDYSLPDEEFAAAIDQAYEAGELTMPEDFDENPSNELDVVAPTPSFNEGDLQSNSDVNAEDFLGEPPTIAPTPTPAEVGTPAEQPTEIVPPLENVPPAIPAGVSEQAPAANPQDAAIVTIEPEPVDWESRVNDALVLKADNREITLSSLDELKKYASKGVNFERKSREAAGDRRYIEVLAENGLKDEGKLQQAIDILNGDKTAISALLKDHNIDPLDIDLDSSYQQTQTIMPAEDYQLGTAINTTVQENPNMNPIIDEIGKWDDYSTSKIRADPEGILGEISAHQQSGLYDKTMNQMASYKASARLSGAPLKSDIVLYHEISQFILGNEAQNNQPPQVQQAQTVPATGTVQPVAQARPPAQQQLFDPYTGQRLSATPQVQQPVNRAPVYGQNPQVQQAPPVQQVAQPQVQTQPVYLGTSLQAAPPATVNPDLSGVPTAATGNPQNQPFDPDKLSTEEYIKWYDNNI
jgi:hypothetical protein